MILFFITFVFTTLATFLIVGIGGGIILGLQPRYMSSGFSLYVLRLLQVIIQVIFGTISVFTPLSALLPLTVLRDRPPYLMGFAVGLILATFLGENIKWYLRNFFSKTSSMQMVIFGVSQYALIKKLFKNKKIIKEIIWPSLLGNAIYVVGLWMTVTVIKTTSIQSYGKYMDSWLSFSSANNVLLIAFTVVFLLMEYGLVAYNNRIIGKKQVDYINFKEEYDNKSRNLLEVQQGFCISNNVYKVELDNDLILDKCKFIWLRGSSGSGKSLFSKAIKGILPGNFKITGKLKKNTEFFYLFQETSLYLFPYIQVGRFVKEITGRSLNQLLPQNQKLPRDTEKRFPEKVNAGTKRLIGWTLFEYVLESKNIKGIILDEPDASLDIVNHKVLVENLKVLLNNVPEKPGLIFITHNEFLGNKLLNELKKINYNIEVFEIKQSIYTNTNNFHIVKLQLQSSEQNNVVSTIGTYGNYPVNTNNTSKFEIEHLTVRWLKDERSAPLIDDFKLRFNSKSSRKKILFIIGRNGRGKSVLLKSIVNLLQREVKKVVVDGVDLTKYSVTQIAPNHIILILDDIERAFPDWMTIGEVFELIGGGKHNYNFTTRTFQEISGGQRQEIVLSELQNIINSESNIVVLLDEPFSRMDARVLNYAFNLLIKSKATFIIVSHNLPIICDYINSSQIGNSCEYKLLIDLQSQRKVNTYNGDCKDLNDAYYYFTNKRSCIICQGGGPLPD